MTDEERDQLVGRAFEVRARAYVPYSHYPVGAAVLLESGLVTRGCNVENGSYGLSICAERSAVFQAVCDSATTPRIRAVAVVTRDGGTPCGACRQVISEFADDDALVIVANERGDRAEYRFAELLPKAFRLISE